MSNNIISIYEYKKSPAIRLGFLLSQFIVDSLFFAIASKTCGNEFAVEACDIATFHALGALSFASEGVGARTKTKFVHLANHLLYAVLSLGTTLRKKSQVADLSRNEKHSRCVFAGCNASSATDTFCSVHGFVNFVLGNQDRICVGASTSGGTDVTTSLDDFVESSAVHHEVTDHGESFGTPRLNGDLVTIVEVTHVKLASSHTTVVAMRTAINIKSAHTANTFTAIVIKANRMCNVIVDELLIQNVEHLEEGTIGADVLNFVGLETTLCFSVFLTPDMKC